MNSHQISNVSERWIARHRRYMFELSVANAIFGDAEERMEGRIDLQVRDEGGQRRYRPKRYSGISDFVSGRRRRKGHVRLDTEDRCPRFTRRQLLCSACSLAAFILAVGLLSHFIVEPWAHTHPRHRRPRPPPPPRMPPAPPMAPYGAGVGRGLWQAAAVAREGAVPPLNPSPPLPSPPPAAAGAGASHQSHRPTYPTPTSTPPPPGRR